MSEGPRAMTDGELLARLLEQIRAYVDVWAAEPRASSRKDALNGLAFSILALLDGCGPLPAFDLVARTHEEDKDFLRGEGENWIEDGTTISTMLHEHWSRAEAKRW